MNDERVAAGERGAIQTVDARRRRVVASAAATTAAARAPRPPPRPASACRAATGRRTARVADAAGALLRLRSERRTRTANERDALAVGRPSRAAVEVDARRKEVDLSRLHVVDADERVIVARATKAIFEPSGDHTGLLWRPHSLMNGTPAVSIAAVTPRATRA